MSNAYTPGSDPMTQALIQMLMQISGGQGAWQGAADPSLLEGLSFGFEPTQMQGQSFPMIPGSSTERKQGTIEELGPQLNASQDMMDLMGLGDLGLGVFAGPGSYSADAFADTVTNELIPRPATDQFNMWLQQGTDTLEGRIADAVARGRSPRSAVIELREIMEAGDREGATEAQQQAANQVRLMLTPIYQSGDAMEPLTGAASIDWATEFANADKMVQPYLEEQATYQPGQVSEVRDADGNIISAGGEIIEGDDGQLYRRTTEPSPLAESYREAGIPLPTEEYTPGDLLGPDWQQADEDYRSSQAMRDDQYALMQQDLQRANGLTNMLDQASIYDFYDRGSVPQLGSGGAPASATGAAPTPTDNLIHPDPAAVGGAPSTSVSAALGAGSANDARMVWQGSGGWTLDQLQQLRDLARANAGATTTREQLDWYNLGRDLEDAIKTVKPPDAVTPEAMDLATQAQGTAAGNMTGQPIEAFFGDPDQSMQWVMQNWSSLSEGDRQGAIQKLREQAGQQIIGSGIGSTSPVMDQWRQLDDLMANLAGGTSVLEWNARQHRGGPAPLQQGVGNAGVGVGGGGAGGVGAPRMAADLPVDDPGSGYVRPAAQYLPGGQQGGWDLATSPGAYLAGMRPHPDQYAVQSGRMSADQARTGPEPSDTMAMIANVLGIPQPNPESTAGQYVHNGAVFDEQDRLIGYMPGAGSNRPNPESTAGQYVHNGAVFDDQDRLLGYMPEPSEATGRTGFLRSLWPDTTPEPLHFGTQRTERGTPRPTGRTASGFRAGRGRNRQDVAVSNARDRAWEREMENARFRVAENQAYAANYGRDYYIARGYTNALRARGVSPTQATLANRSQGLQDWLNGNR